ncbi:UNVERIFIED_ORG: hypothetical protein J2W64_000690 [Rahnella aquatilis]|uniref:hypothetical protein n=1 Tax=Rahnella sp. 2050 TaxID=3156425 RepID=UPI001B4A74FF|nr:hypothetical protein [Rahnella aquatilis]
MDQQVPKWIHEARKMISGSEDRVKDFWDSLPETQKRRLCLFANLTKQHLSLSWAQLKEKDKIALWRGILAVRELHQQTSLFMPHEFKGVAVFNLSDRAIKLAERAELLAQRIDSETQNSMH